MLYGNDEVKMGTRKDRVEQYMNLEEFESYEYTKMGKRGFHWNIIHDVFAQAVVPRDEIEQLLEDKETFYWACSLLGAEEVLCVRDGKYTDFFEYYRTIGRMWLVLDSVMMSTKYITWTKESGVFTNDTLLFLLYDVLVPLETSIKYVQGLKDDEDVFYMCLQYMMETWEDRPQ